MQSVVSERIGLALVDCHSIPVWSSSPRTDVLGHSQSSPFDKLRAGSSGLIAVVNLTQDSVLGYSQPSLRD
jgi:hypothetical protein